MNFCKLFFGWIICAGFSTFIFGQTPTPKPLEDKEIKVFTEEIKLNFSAFDESGGFVNSMQKEDLVILENGRIHQPTSLQRIPANVFIVLDTGGDFREVKNINNLREITKKLVDNLQATDSISLVQYYDQAEILVEPTTDKALILNALEKKLTFGKRSNFPAMIDLVKKTVEKSALDNCHLILITDGLNAFADLNQKEETFKKILGTAINFHVISLTQMGMKAIGYKRKVWREGEHKPKRMPEEVENEIRKTISGFSKEDLGRTFGPPRLFSIVLDPKMRREAKQKVLDLAQSEADLAAFAENTNGEIFIPDSIAEILAKTVVLARNIDSQFVLTYTPKRALSDLTEDEFRLIEVTSRRSTISIQGKRLLFVKAVK